MIKNISPLPNFLINRYNDWKSNVYLDKSNKFKKLASLGQNPIAMIISCCDSRILASSIFGAEEGEFFIHRNIGNLIPPFSNDLLENGTAAAIEYATKVLKVKHIIVLGHTNCGGVKSGYDLFKNKKKSN